MYFAVCRTLQEHPVLLQLYRDLVITQVITSEEFWSQHAAEYTQAKKTQRQEIGVNSAFLVRPPSPSSSHMISLRMHDDDAS